MKVAFLTLGCKVNQYETQILEQYFKKDGFVVVSTDDNSDIYIINSCTVTSNSDRKTRQIINRFKKQSPNAVIALTGCMPQAFPAEAQILEEVDVITGAYNRQGLLNAVKKTLETGEKVIDITSHTKDSEFEKMSLENFSGRTRAYVKIQDGCERFCAYCIIPTARGPMRSKPIEEVREEITNLSKNGFKEVVLVGINLSCYGIENGSNLMVAVRVACSVDGIKRVRLSSLEPELLEIDKLKELAKEEKFCPQFHLSLQSGSDNTLKRMDRHYDTETYEKILANIRKVFENPAITTDVMVGFPGETEEEFRESLEFMKKIKLAKTHVFAYSRRKGTKADLMADQISSEVKAIRSKKMRDVTEESRKIFFESQIGSRTGVLFESEKSGAWYGQSENYTPVFVNSNENLSNKIRQVEIIKADENNCMGKIVTN